MVLMVLFRRLYSSQGREEQEEKKCNILRKEIFGSNGLFLFNAVYGYFRVQRTKKKKSINDLQNKV